MKKKKEFRVIMTDLLDSISPLTFSVKEYRTRKSIGSNTTPKKKKRK